MNGLTRGLRLQSPDLTSSMKPGFPPREMMKELRTDRAMK